MTPVLKSSVTTSSRFQRTISLDLLFVTSRTRCKCVLGKPFSHFRAIGFFITTSLYNEKRQFFFGGIKLLQRMWENPCNFRKYFTFLIIFVAAIPGDNLAVMCFKIKASIETEQKKTLWIPSGSL